jgi:hypothetical protein
MLFTNTSSKFCKLFIRLDGKLYDQKTGLTGSPFHFDTVMLAPSQSYEFTGDLIQTRVFDMADGSLLGTVELHETPEAYAAHWQNGPSGE